MFLQQVEKIMLQKVPTDNHVLLGDDFIIVMDLRKDQKTDARTSASSNYHRIISTLNYIKGYYQIQDIWRVNPLASCYTWRKSNPSRVSSCLDYWLSSENLFNYVTDCDIIPCVKLDHSAVTLQLNSLESNAKGRRYWKLNTSYLTEEAYIKGIRNLKTTCEEEYTDIGDDQLKWELMKFRIREYSVKYGIEKAKKVSSEENVLDEELRALEAQEDAVGNLCREQS